MKHAFFITALAFSLISCGKSDGGNGSSSSSDKPDPVVIDLDADFDGEYLAVLKPLNQEITGKITGAFTFARDKEGDEVVGDVRLNNAGPKIIHAQHVRVGNRCPDMTDDLNGDGIIDALEGEVAYGRILFPLDGDLSSQSSHDGEFPVGDIYGNYIYSRVTTFTEFIKDLRSKDRNEDYVKLKDNEPLDIEGRVVVIHGVDQASGLPATVGSTGRMAPHQSLPIACGVIYKVLLPPGEIDNDIRNLPEEELNL